MGCAPCRRSVPGTGAILPIAQDPRFREAFVEQLLNLAGQLRVIARDTGSEPMALDLTDLVAWARRVADDRLAQVPLSPREGGGSPPPG